MVVTKFRTMAEAVQALTQEQCSVAVVETAASGWGGDATCDVLCLTESARNLVVGKFIGVFQSQPDYPRDPSALHRYPHIVVYREAQEIVATFAV